MTDPEPTGGPRPDVNDVRAVHGGLRREFRLFPDLLTAATDAGEEERVAALRDHWALITGILHRHHGGEDELLWPVLEGRSAAVEDVVPLMREQHEAMLATLAEADAVVADWSGTDPATLAPVRRLAGELSAHLDAEEADVLPLAEALLSVDEWEALGVHGRAGVPPDKMPVVACMLMEDADEAALAAFLAPMPPEVQGLATGPWQEVYAGYVATLRGG